MTSNQQRADRNQLWIRLKECTHWHFSQKILQIRTTNDWVAASESTASREMLDICCYIGMGLNSKPCFLPWLNIIKIREKLRKRVHSTVVNVTLKHTASITINQFSCSDLLLWVHLHRCVLIQCQHKTQPNYCVKAPTLGRWLLPTPMSAACCVANVSQSGTALLLKLKPCIFFPSHRNIYCLLGQYHAEIPKLETTTRCHADFSFRQYQQRSSHCFL